MEPRKLTEDEIQDLLSVIPDIKSVADTVSQANTKSMKVLVREQLKDIVITPLGISDLKSEIVRQYNDSIITPGTMVGVTAAESLSKPITQMALNSFHASGSSKNVTGGVERISELINATRNPKKTSCNIFFKDDFLSFNDIIQNKRPEITEITLKKLVIGIPDIESYTDIVEPFWYSYYRQIVGKKFKSKHVLRLNINTNILYAYKLTMEDICSKVESDGSVVCVYSPMSVGKIDIYPIEQKITSILNKENIVSSENSSLIFLSKIILENLDQIKISGISGIKEIYPVESPVLQIVKEEQKDRDNDWFLILNPIRMKITGIGVNNLSKLCEVSGVKVLKKAANYLTVQSDTSPLDKIRDAVQRDENLEKEKLKKGNDYKSEISRYSKLVYADTTGSNFTELLSNPTIDAKRTICNDVHEIKEAFGIEAARTFLTREFIDVLGFESYINPRHIVLLSDFMTSLGDVYGVTFTGLSRQPVSALEKASFQKAMDVFKEASGFGEQKTVSGTTSSVFIGKKALVGTGYSEDYIKPENLERYNLTRKQLLEDKTMTLDANSFNEAIQDFSLGGEEVNFLQDLEKEMFSTPTETPNVEPLKIVSAIPSAEIITKGAPVMSEELFNSVNELQEEMMQNITCSKEKFPEVIVTSGPTQTAEFQMVSVPVLPMPAMKSKPKPTPIKIFSLEEFLK